VLFVIVSPLIPFLKEVSFWHKQFRKGPADTDELCTLGRLDLHSADSLVFSLPLLKRTFGEQLAFGKECLQLKPTSWRKESMISLDQIKITRRDQQVLNLLVQGCSNKEIAAELEISPRTVKQHLRTLFLRAGIKQGRKRVILATAIFEKEQMNHVPKRADELD
jgi:DNA-binding CsgD family transcriptional regulator